MASMENLFDSGGALSHNDPADVQWFYTNQGGGQVGDYETLLDWYKDYYGSSSVGFPTGGDGMQPGGGGGGLPLPTGGENIVPIGQTAGPTVELVPNAASGGSTAMTWLDNILKAGTIAAPFLVNDSSGRRGGIGGGYPSGPGSNQAWQTLVEILSRQGQADPRNLNRQRVGIQRGTQNLQNDADQRLAMMGPGMQQSGTAQALQAAIGAGGEERMAAFEARETAAAEQRMRDDLLLWLQLFVNPSLDARALESGIQMANRQYDTQRNAANTAAVASVTGSLLDNWDTLFPKRDD